MVCCEHCIITHNGSKRDYWVLYDKYKVSASSNVTLVNAQELQSVRNMVLAGKYNSNVQKKSPFQNMLTKKWIPLAQ
jgi:hypothetical protein